MICSGGGNVGLLVIVLDDAPYNSNESDRGYVVLDDVYVFVA